MNITPEVAIALLTALGGLIAAVTKLVQEMRSHSDTRAKLGAAIDSTTSAAAALEVASRLFPNSKELAYAKVMAHKFATSLDAERETLARVVVDVTGSVDRVIERVTVDQPLPTDGMAAVPKPSLSELDPASRQVVENTAEVLANRKATR